MVAAASVRAKNRGGGFARPGPRPSVATDRGLRRIRGMAPRQITDERALATALGAERYLLFKHSNRCYISTVAFRQYGAFAAAHPEVPTGWIDVLAQREWSRRIARETGVKHESPQALWIRDGWVAWNASHGGITAAELDRVTG
jgi:bacillithiol system protein YtxJ